MHPKALPSLPIEKHFHQRKEIHFLDRLKWFLNACILQTIFPPNGTLRNHTTHVPDNCPLKFPGPPIPRLTDEKAVQVYSYPTLHLIRPVEP